MPEYTQIDCATSETAHAVHAYLLIQLGEDEEAPNIIATVEGSGLRVMHNYDNDVVRRNWDLQLIGYRDGRESLEGTLRQLRDRLQHQPDVVRLIDSALGIRAGKDAATT